MDPAHALYVLLDSNLPTGGFVASGGLESYAKHGFLHPTPPPAGEVVLPQLDKPTNLHPFDSHPRPVSAPALGPTAAAAALMHFSNAELDNFDATTGYYLAAAWRAVSSMEDNTQENVVSSVVSQLCTLDEQHEVTLLSHVARRASRAQGVALLTLYARGMRPPPGFENGSSDLHATVIAEYRRAIRLGTPGHLAVCFGVVAAAVGLDLHTARHLYLFTHVRSTLSAAVRLNIVGPYLSTQLLSHPARQELAAVLARERDLPKGGVEPQVAEPVKAETLKAEALKAESFDIEKVKVESFEPQGKVEGADPVSNPTRHHSADWGWAEEAERGPATTWPLGEILAARHDMQHSRIFNS